MLFRGIVRSFSSRGSEQGSPDASALFRRAESDVTWGAVFAKIGRFAKRRRGRQGVALLGASGGGREMENGDPSTMCDGAVVASGQALVGSSEVRR